jgi:dihydroflavonol-4-reductase
MTNLVTGGTGFVGGAIVRRLLAAKQPVRVLARSAAKAAELQAAGAQVAVGDVLDPASLRTAMDGVSTLYHAAAQYEVWTAKPQEMLDTANQGTRNVMQAALDAGVRRVVHTSSAAAFGLPKDGNVDEQMAEPGLLPDVYYRSKYESELIANTYIDKGLQAVTLNPSNVYGPRDLKPLGSSLVSLLNEQLPAMWEATTPIVYVEDVAEAHLLAAEKGKPGERYLLVERNVSYRELFGKAAELGGVKLPPFLPVPMALVTAYGAELAARLTGKPPLVSVMQVKSGTQGTLFDGSKAPRELGFQYTDMDAGLRATIKWYWEQGLLKKKPVYL